MKQRLFHPGRPELPNELAELGWPGDQMMWEALCAAFEEAHADYYQVQTEGDQEEAGALGVFVPHRSFLNMTRKALKCPECDRRYLQLAITELTGITHGESFAIRLSYSITRRSFEVLVSTSQPLSVTITVSSI